MNYLPFRPCIDSVTMRFTEGVAACKAFAFNDPQLPRLCTNMATVHTASAHVAEKIGMK